MIRYLSNIFILNATFDIIEQKVYY